MDGIELAERAFKDSAHMRVYQAAIGKAAQAGPSSMFEFTREDTFQIESHFERLKVSEFCCALLAAFGFSCGSLLYDLTYPHVDTSEIELTIDYLFALCTLSTVLLAVCIGWRTYLEFVWQRAKGEQAIHHSLFSSGKYKPLLLELGVVSLHPVWFLRGQEFAHYNKALDYEAQYSYNAMLAFAMLLRVYLPIRYLSIVTHYRSSRAQRVCNMNGSYAGTWFAIKCMMMDRPLLLISSLMVLSIFMGGYSIRIFERPFVAASGQDFSDYGNSMWLAILTMTTVGYGDFYPVTVAGRGCVFVICMWGVLVVSLMVVTLTNLLTLDSGEQNALLLYNRLRFKDALRDHAANVIAAVVRYRKMYKRDPENSKKLNERLGNLRICINRFHHLKLQQRSLYDLDAPDDRIERKINTITEGTDKLEERADVLISRIQRYLVQKQTENLY